MFDFVFQITAFVALLTLDEMRKESNRADVLFCIKYKEPKKEREEFISYAFDHYYIPVIFNRFTKLAVLIIFLCLLAISAIGCVKMTRGMN